MGALPPVVVTLTVACAGALPLPITSVPSSRCRERVSWWFPLNPLAGKKEKFAKIDEVDCEAAVGVIALNDCAEMLHALPSMFR